MQPKKMIKLTEAEKKIISQYTAYNNSNMTKTIHSATIHKITK